MRRAIGQLGLVLAVAGAAAVGRFGEPLGTVHAGERLAFLPFPTGNAPTTEPKQQRPELDSARVRRLLQTARGANTLMCELAAATVDGRSGWWSGSDGDFRPGGAGDSVAREIETWVRHHEVDASTVPLLRDALADSDWCVRRLAAPLLGRVRSGSATQAMRAALAASDAVTREMGALALGFAEDSTSIAPLASLLRDTSPRVRATAAWALGEMERREVVGPLVDALKDSDALVRESAARALGEVEDATAIPALTDVLKSDRDASVRRAAARALGEIIG